MTNTTQDTLSKKDRRAQLEKAKQRQLKQLRKIRQEATAKRIAWQRSAIPGPTD